MDRRHKAALWYARRGWRVFPCWPIRNGRCACGHGCDSPGKHPVEFLTGDWRQSATTGEAVIDGWWQRVSDANVATSSWLRIDVDTKKNGIDNWRWLTLDHPLPDTPVCLTPSGGEHYYFQAPEGVKIGNGIGELPAGIDVRGPGAGYTLLPPSNHLQGVYDWEPSGRPDEVAVAPVPDWLLDLLPLGADAGSVSFGATLPAPDLAQWELPSSIVAAITGDRSRLDQAIITALIFAGAVDDEIRAVFQHYGTTGKYAEKGDRYLALSIAKARAFVARRQAAQEEPAAQSSFTTVTQAFRKRRVTA